MNVFDMITLAEIQHAERLKQAERDRLAQRAARPRSGRKQRGFVLPDALMALRARIRALRRPDLTKPIDLAPAAAETP